MIKVTVQQPNSVLVNAKGEEKKRVTVEPFQLIEKGSAVEFGTMEHWDSRTEYIPTKGTICVYEDHTVVDGNNFPAIKIADGLAYLIDQPFIGEGEMMIVMEHIMNDSIHVTEQEKEFWNNKVSCYEIDGNLVFTTD